MRVGKRVRLRSDEGIDEAIEQASAARDDANDGKTGKHDALGDEDGHAFCDQGIGGHVVVDEPVADDARKYCPAKLSDREEADGLPICKRPALHGYPFSQKRA